MFYAMQCREEVPFETPADAATEAAALPAPIRVHYAEAFAGFHFAMCETSTSGIADPIAALAVTSEIPALVLAGTFDPATPPAWGEATARALENATYVEFMDLGHGVMRLDPCGLAIGLAFIDDPAAPVDTTCALDRPPITFAGS